ncbi:hypothetical protein [Legionella bononiensis]|uniref:Esterase with patatin domain protein n=1 Tax=Legionella bononiensis TaxID=2793102 RepID=A0ABS1WA15_9GAMM|nr:hypothetical protein [Legionella bononiensis]MBL7480563.1 hypothetical protein [Legionella bononiensis]MBL7526198.1 hypothetical protein [Legionella bononiensis]MBL7563307.1 hypothetical protein [Legionella bononiensis]
MPHSQLYQTMVNEASYRDETENKLIKEQRLDSERVVDLINNTPNAGLQDLYSEMGDLLRETNDAQFGIVSQLVQVDGEEQWVRDATHSVPLEERMPHNAPVIEANNALLRCLSRLRPIDFAINQKLGDQDPGPACRDRLKVNFQELTRAVLETAQSGKSNSEKLKAITKLETEFNSTLVKELHEANLTQGCDTAEQAEKLLFHYRNLSSLLENPARTMVTLTYDKTARVFQRETQYPVTEKTQAQHDAIKELAKIQPYPFSEEKNAHNSKNTAIQEADALFVDLMDQDTTALSAQARKTHPVGAKNAFIVKNELIPMTEEVLEESDLNTVHADQENTLWLARMGVPVYVGSGESSKAVEAHTIQNLEQMRMAAERRMNIESPRLHVTCLNTYSPLENQTTMINNLYKATRKQGNGDDITYAPTNPDGTFRSMDVAPNLHFAEGEAPVGTLPLQKANRLAQVTKVVLAAAQKDATVSIVQCASGQDRTGTAVEKSTQIWMQKRYEQMGRNPANIETMRAEGGNAAEITTHHIHGSPGMKTDSMANNFFGSSTAFSSASSEQFYLSSAKTNKQNKVGNVDFLKIPSDEARNQYGTNLREFELSLADFARTISGDQKKQQLYDSGQDVLRNIKKIAAENPDSRSLADLNATLPHCTYVIQNHDQPDNPEYQESMRRLASLSQHVSGATSPGWKALGAGLMTFTCLALIVAGVLAAIPTGGTSLLMTVVGAAGLSVGTAVGIGVGAVAVTAGTGFAAYKAGSEHGLAHSISEFKSALHEIKHDEKVNEDPSPPNDDISYKH